MEELLSNIYCMVENHFKFKMKSVKYSNSDTKGKIEDAITKVAEDIYDYADDALRSTNFFIDEEIGTMKRDYDEELLKRQHYNVFKVKRVPVYKKEDL